MSSQGSPSDQLDVEELVVTLNDLLDNLHIPILLDTPLDLTPLLLLAILESILKSRLPISPEIRKSREPSAKVQAMKIVLEVLENDIISEDVGLSDVDPEKLAEGQWDEVVFLGDLLCWLGKTYGVIPVANANAKASSGRQQEERDPFGSDSGMHTTSRSYVRTPSPTTNSTATTTRNSAHSALSMMPSAPPQSDTTMSTMRADSPSLSVLDLFDTNTPPVLEEMSRMRLNSVTPPPRVATRTPDVEGLSFMNVKHSTPPRTEKKQDLPPNTSASFCHCPSDEEDELTPRRNKTVSPVRYTGWISEVDEELEIRSFEESRRRPQSHLRASPALARSTQSDPDRRTKFDLYAGISSTSTPRKPSTRRSSTSGKNTSHGPIVTRHTSPTEHTLALVNERAKLMAELASVKSVPNHRLPPGWR